jgi:DeoR/GlpR family transcriptional regulator of sugar metabolism
MNVIMSDTSRTRGDRELAIPSRPGLRQEKRLDAIAELVLASGTLRIDELSEVFSVSSMTIHRDLDLLDQRGILRKTRGAATAVASSLFEASTEYRIRQSQQAKKALAQAALALIEPGQSVMMDDSTTGLHLARLLPEKLPLTVITNFQRVADLLVSHAGIQTIMTGGQFYRWCDAYMGTIALNAVHTLRADIVFMSSPAVTNGVCYHQHHDAVMLKQAMIESAEHKVLYLDHTKFKMRALHAHLKVSDFDTVIVDSETAPEYISQIEDTGVRLIIAP